MILRFGVYVLRVTRAAVALAQAQLPTHGDAGYAD